MADSTTGHLALVFSGGGARAAYQVGALLGIAERAGEGFRFPIVTGVSAGAINAARIASAETSLPGAARALADGWMALSVRRVFNPGLFALLYSGFKAGVLLTTAGRLPGFPVRGLLNTKPLRHTMSRFLQTEGIDANIAAGRLRAVALTATSYATGHTVTFVQGSDDVPTWRRAGRVARQTRITVDHVMASTSLPIVFPAAEVDGEYFGDGTLRQTAPLAPAIHLGARGLLVLAVRYGGWPTQASAGGYPPPAQIMGMLLNSIFLDAVDADAERVSRVNRSLPLLTASAPHPEGLRPIELCVLRPSRDLGELAVDLGKHLPTSLRFLIRGLESSRRTGQDLLSYLLFERPYIERLIELGRADALAEWDRIAPLLEGRAPDATSALSR